MGALNACIICVAGAEGSPLFCRWRWGRGLPLLPGKGEEGEGRGRYRQTFSIARSPSLSLSLSLVRWPWKLLHRTTVARSVTTTSPSPAKPIALTGFAVPSSLSFFLFTYCFPAIYLFPLLLLLHLFFFFLCMFFILLITNSGEFGLELRWNLFSTMLILSFDLCGYVCGNWFEMDLFKRIISYLKTGTGENLATWGNLTYWMNWIPLW